jgi:hypothetical protein
VVLEAMNSPWYNSIHPAGKRYRPGTS